MMIRSKYEVIILGYNGLEINRFSEMEFVSLDYDRVYNDIGSISLLLSDSLAEWAIDNLMLPHSLDYFIEVYRENIRTGRREKEDTYLLRLANPYLDENDILYFAIGGLSLNHLFSRRVLVPDDDPLSANGYITDAGISSQVIARLVRAHLGDLATPERQLPFFDVHFDYTGERAGGRWRYENLLEIIQDLGYKGKVQFNINHMGGGYLVCQIGTLYNDYTVGRNYPGGEYILLKKELDNFSEQSLTLDYQEEKNVIYARGGGNDENEIVLTDRAERKDNSPYNRIEFEEGVDTEEGETSLALLTEIDSKLKENLPVVQLDFPIVESLGFQYRADWDLGDRLTAQWGSFNRDLRITGISNSVSDGSDDLSISIEAEEVRI